MGFDNTRKEGQMVVVTNNQPPQTQIEVELGMTEENLRLQLFSRTGLQERLVHKLQQLTGVEVFTRKEVEETFKLWLDHLYEHDRLPKTTKSTSKKAQD